ncbi:helix-turn-helix domain-containing protein [Burkholderia gladioli]|uniref:helix-turn-helix domain-containing protein n=1 Tax=Burkholderia gladioli TaxID=28095 RepID=UPI001641D00A|nr:helix-turn-helix domain-containing protein [Burkholderia gladioli]
MEREEMPGPFLKFDSSRIDDGEAEEIWREALRPLYVVERNKEARFRAKIEVWDMGAMLMTRHFAFDDVQFRRTRGKIASTPADQFLVHCLLGGELASEFEGSQQKVPVNSIALRDLAVENIGYARSAPMLTLSIPRASLERRLPGGARLHAAAWGPKDPIGAMLAAHLKYVAKLAPAMTDDQARTAGDATLALLASCLLPKAKPATRRDDPRLAPMLRTQAMAFIERNLPDPDLDAEMICRAVGISRTALYELFVSSGGVARHVRARRLDESMRRLRASATGPKERIAEIAYGLGFASESSFSRSFRDRFGCAPSSARDGSEPPPKESSQPDTIGTAYEAKVQSLAI